MLRKFGWFYKALGLGFAMGRVRFEDHSAERIRHAARTGPIVYVLLQRSTLDHLALNAVLTRRRLPLSVWSHGAISFFWQPVREAWRDLFLRVRDRWQRGPLPDPVGSGWLTGTIAAGQPVCLFLEDGTEAGPDPEVDPLTAVLDAAALTDRSIQLVPVICVWDRAPEAHESAALTFLRGSRERPTLWTRLAALFLPRRQRPFVQVGEPLDVDALLARVSRERARDAARTILRRYLKRESRTVRGPALLPRRVLKQLVLQSPAIRRFATDHAAASGQPGERVERALSTEFDKVAADFRFGAIRTMSWVMHPLWNRVYAGYEIPPEDLDRIRSAMRNGTAVLVPCHKSHFDYLLLSWVLFYADLIVPHIVAGVNLAIWPVSLLLRACGAFFIERSFAGKPIHAAVFRRYLREILLHGYTLEFFVEGGRTRTGRLLPPKGGVLEMVLDGARHAPAGHEVTLLPVAISYEQVAEERAYQSELGGAEKRKESFRELLKARRVLRNRYGRVFVRVGEPLVASSVIAGWDDLDEDARRARVLEIGETLVHRIGEVVTILPTSVVALALLAHHRGALPDPDLKARVLRLVAWFGRRNAPMTPLVAQHADAAMARALDRFLAAGHVRAHGVGDTRVWEVVPDHRMVLDFHKNQVMQHLVAAGMVTAALHATGDDVDRADLVEPVARLRGLWAREIVLPPHTSDADLVDDGLRDLSAHGAVDLEGARVRVVDPERAGEIHGLVRAVLESYAIAVEAVLDADARPGDLKAWTRTLTGLREAWIASGRATRPEAFATVPLQNALKVLIDRGVLRQDGATLTADRDAAAALRAWLAPMVGSAPQDPPA